AAYNIACAFALLGEKKEALDWLDKAVGLGWDNLEHTEQDPDLESVRGEARFRKVLEKLKSE
ncbi:MAG TPA: transglutaminase domain-containing protein, partial [Planctomycetota bacterium]|nr:transglutaminase domain-containing protein [Planctomycetota bacterium]